MSVLYVPESGAGPERILLYGLGKPDEITVERVRRAVGDAAVEAVGLRAGTVAFALPAGDALPAADQARAVVESALLALYEFTRYRSETPEDAVPV